MTPTGSPTRSWLSCRAPSSRPTSTRLPASTPPPPGRSSTVATRPFRTVTSAVRVLHGAARSVSVPQVARTRDAGPHRSVYAPMPFTGSAYWLSPRSGSFPSAVSTAPRSISRSSRARPSWPTPMTSSVVAPGGIAGPNRWPFGHRALQLPPRGDRRADRGAGRFDARVLGLGDIEEVAVDRAHRVSRSGQFGHRRPRADRPRVQQVGRDPGFGQIDRQQMPVHGAARHRHPEFAVLPHQAPPARQPSGGGCPARRSPAPRPPPRRPRTPHATSTVSTARTRPNRSFTIPPDVLPTVPCAEDTHYDPEMS